MNEAAHTISLISPSKSWKSSCSFNTSNSDPTWYILHFTVLLMSVKLALRVEKNETFQTCHDPFDTKKFSNLNPEILVEWITPSEQNSKPRWPPSWILESAIIRILFTEAIPAKNSASELLIRFSSKRLLSSPVETNKKQFRQWSARKQVKTSIDPTS